MQCKKYYRSGYNDIFSSYSSCFFFRSYPATLRIYLSLHAGITPGSVGGTMVYQGLANCMQGKSSTSFIVYLAQICFMLKNKNNNGKWV